MRKAFRMSVYPGRETEYEARHSPIWPELERTLVSHGVHHYSSGGELQPRFRRTCR